VSIVAVRCNKNDFDNRVKYKELRDSIAKAIEVKKFQKFNLVDIHQPVLEYDKSINNQTLCRICNIRKLNEDFEDRCEICNSFVYFGEQLVSNASKVSIKKLGINLDEEDFMIELSESIKSYVLKSGDSYATFDTLADRSCIGFDTGLKALGVLKADVDNMGNFIKESSVTDKFENFDLFSKTLDNFFSLYIPQKLMKDKYKNTYTVFAGGDDLFLVGAWDEIVELSRKIQDAFKAFVKSDKLSISFGIAIAKPTHPISHLAEYTEHLLEEAKAIDENKNAITLFGETVKWKSYLSTFDKLKEAFETIKDIDTKTAFLYRLLELVEMAKKVKYENDIASTMWKSKLAYSFGRNMPKGYEALLQALNEEIELNPKETKMFLSEFIYKRRG